MIQKEDIQIVVYYIDDERVAWIKNQFKELNISIDVKYTRGYTKDQLLEYMDEMNTKYKHIETENQLSCFKSFTQVVSEFFKNTNKNYLITLEDDSCLLLDDFEQKIIELIDLYNKNRTEFDYITAGYLPFDIKRLMDRNISVDKNIHWGMWKNSINEFDDVWGGQMLILDRIICGEIVNLFDHDKISTIRKFVDMRLRLGVKYSSRANILLGDHILPILFRQSVCYPPLCIEGNFNSGMEHGKNNFENRSWAKYLDIDKYYINK